MFVDIPFEFSLCLMLLVSIIVTHSLFVLYSFCYAEEIFEVSLDWRCRMVTILLLVYIGYFNVFLF